MNRIAGICLVLSAVLSAECQADKLIRPDFRSKLFAPNERGERLYSIWFDAAFVESLGPAGEAPARDFHDPENLNDFRGWHRPEVRKMVRLIEHDYDISATSMTSWAFPTMTAFLSDSALRKMESDFRVDTIYVVVEDSFSAAPPWIGVPDPTLPLTPPPTQPELNSYGRIAMDMNDALGTSTRVYMLDAGINNANILHADISSSVTQATIGFFCSSGAGHAMHIAGILSAAHNGVSVKGMNNGSPVTSVNKSCGNEPDAVVRAQNALDWVVGETEFYGTYNVINLSSNSPPYANNGEVAKFIRKASARNLIVQSAGNSGSSNACTEAFGPTSDRDGVLVVGAVNYQGKRAVNWDNSRTGYGGGSSNYGSCVEVWAPGQDIWSTWTGAGTSREVLSGTSMAAPHVAAMAARGGSSMNPVIREAYVRSKLFSTGFNENHPSGAATKVPSHTKTPTFTLPTKLTPVSLTVSSTYGSNTASRAVDGNYLTTSWNSGVAPNYPSVQPYFQMDLGSTKTLWSIRLIPSQSPSGTSIHEVWVGNTDPPTTLALSFNRNLMNGETLAATLAGHSGRYVRIVTRFSPSWAAYYEIEVFGN